MPPISNRLEDQNMDDQWTVVEAPEDDVVVVPIKGELIDRTLAAYVPKGTRYLQGAAVQLQPLELDESGVPIEDDSAADDYCVSGQFLIRESCYISSATAPFGAVEFSLCYWQLLYVALAHACDTQSVDALQGLSLATFYQKQWDKVQMTRLESFFRRPIQSQELKGQLTVWKVKAVDDTLVLKTEVEFSDSHRGFAYGSVDLAIAP